MAAFLTNGEVILIGIAGATCSGKSAYAKHLVDRLQSPLNAIGLDDFFTHGVPIQHPILGQTMNEELPETLDTQSLIELLRQIKSDPTKITRYHRSDTTINTQRSMIVVVEGFILFALSNELTKLFDIRLFFEANQNQCRSRRYRRHYRVPSHVTDNELSIPKSFQTWFDHLVWMEYLRQRDLQLSQVQKNFSSDQYNHYQYGQIDDYIDRCLTELIADRAREKRTGT